uniref:HTH CENPB-type domain-containing protein n=1 Tax=Rhizophagus irregularis (strain DAOM 181602 / DAOM 197198 / MUCL 43194) TaxID=747089 RepID=U9UDI2_RHIID
MSQQEKRKSTKESSQPNKRVVLTHWLFINPDSEESNKQREKQVHFPQVEEALSLWITNALSANFVINASNGWMDKFKKQYNLKEHVKWGEANSAPLKTLDEKRNKLREILKNYDLNNGCIGILN